MGTTWGTRAVRAARVVLGLPAQRPAPVAEDVDAWVAASRPPGTGPEPGPTKASVTAAGSPATGASVPWTDMEEDRRGAALRKVARFAFWAVLLLAAVTGVRSWVAPDRPAPAPAPVAAVPPPSFPADAARQVAARWARSYLTWDAARPQDREAALAADMAVGADARQGWDRAGRQDVVDVAAGQVTQSGADRARVRVDVLVHPHPAATAGPAATPPAQSGAGAPPLADGPRWVALDVPIAVAGHRVVVTGAPGLLGLPAAPPAVAAMPARPADSALGTETHDTVRAFFAAAGEGGDVAALAAPGAEVAPLPPGFAFAGLRSWSVDSGGGETRTGTATVLWQVGGGQLTQVYRVEMTRVTSAAGQRWQVAAVHGGDV